MEKYQDQETGKVNYKELLMDLNGFDYENPYKNLEKAQASRSLSSWKSSIQSNT